jgi:hypothetical protein
VPQIRDARRLAVRQRNPGPHPLILPTLDPPREVLEGEEIDHPELLAGFEPVDPADPPSAGQDDPADLAASDAAAQDVKPKPRNRGQRAGDSTEEATTR